MPTLSQRQVVLALMAIQLGGMLLMLVGQLIKEPEPVVLAANACGLLLAGALLAAYWRGWEPARYLNVIVATLLVGVGTPDAYVRQTTALIALVPAAVALVFAGPGWTIASAAGLLLIFTIRTGGLSSYTNDLRTIAAYVIVVGSMVLSRLVTDGLQRATAAERARAEDALAHAERQAAELGRQAAELAAQNARQQQLLGLVAALETPAVSLADGVLLAPIVGSLDTSRAAGLARRLLEAASQQRARLIIIDVAGIAALDAEAAQGLLHMVQALRLLGCSVTVTGISPVVAATLTGLGSAIQGLPTARSPQDVLASYTAAGQA